MMLNDKADSGIFADADADRGNVADSPVDDGNGADESGAFAGDGVESAEGSQGQDSGDEDGASEDDPSEEEAASATPQPGKKPAQSKREDTRYATARKEADEKRRAAEAEKHGMQERMDSFARSYGYETFAAMEQAEQVRRYVESGMPAAAAQELSFLRQEMNDAKGRAASAERAFERQGLYGRLLEECPETWGMRDLPQEVYDAVDAGETPVNAYRAWENRQLKERLRVLEQRGRNDRKAVGSARGAATGMSTPDSFTDGLLRT